VDHLSQPERKALANDEASNCEALDDDRWLGAMADVLADVIAAVTAASGQVGAVTSDGERPLAAFS
jgi:hypothetical protein